jgi:hypothetical protein
VSALRLQEAQFEQERTSRDTGHRESMSSTLGGAGLVQQRENEKFFLPDGATTLSFEHMREIGKTERGQKRVKIKREEPTEDDRNQARDLRARQSILGELMLSEVAYLLRGTTEPQMDPEQSGTN